MTPSGRAEIAERTGRRESLLKRLVDVPSGSRHRPGVARVVDLLADMTVEVTIGAQRSAKWPVNVNRQVIGLGDGFSHPPLRNTRPAFF